MTRNTMKMQDSPCQSCKNRFVGCHGKCELYREYREKRDAMNAKKHEDTELTKYFVSTCLDNIYKRKRRHQGGNTKL